MFWDIFSIGVRVKYLFLCLRVFPVHAPTRPKLRSNWFTVPHTELGIKVREWFLNLGVRFWLMHYRWSKVPLIGLRQLVKTHTLLYVHVWVLRRGGLRVRSDPTKPWWVVIEKCPMTGLYWLYHKVPVSLQLQRTLRRSTTCPRLMWITFYEKHIDTFLFKIFGGSKIQFFCFLVEPLKNLQRVK